MEPRKFHEIPQDMAIFEMIGFYHIFDPNNTKIYNYNVFQFISIVISFIVLCITLYGTLGFFMEMEGIVDIIDYIQIVGGMMQTYFGVLKILMFIYNKNIIWAVLDITRPNFIKSKQSKDIGIQREHRRTIIKVSNIIFIFLISFFIIWIVFPLIINSFMVKSNDGTRRFENILNLRYPVTINVFNDYYLIFYLAEVLLMVYVVYSALIHVLLINYICNVFAMLYKLNTIAFKQIGHQQPIINGKLVTLVY